MDLSLNYKTCQATSHMQPSQVSQRWLWSLAQPLQDPADYKIRMLPNAPTQVVQFHANPVWWVPFKVMIYNKKTK